MYSYGSPHTAAQKQDDQHERTFSSYVRIQVVVLKTCLGRWTIGRSGERGSGISVLPARYDDDDDDDCCCSCSFEREIINIGQSSHKMYSNNILIFQESTSNACTKKSLETYWRHLVYMRCAGSGVYIFFQIHETWYWHEVVRKHIHTYIYIYIYIHEKVKLNLK